MLIHADKKDSHIIAYIPLSNFTRSEMAEYIIFLYHYEILPSTISVRIQMSDDWRHCAVIPDCLVKEINLVRSFEIPPRKNVESYFKPDLEEAGLTVSEAGKNNWIVTKN